MCICVTVGIVFFLSLWAEIKEKMKTEKCSYATILKYDFNSYSLDLKYVDSLDLKGFIFVK